MSDPGTPSSTEPPPGPETVASQTPARTKRPHLIRRLYDWVLHWGETPYATPALALMSFAEASFFPIPPDPLLIAMGLNNRKRAFRHATVCSVASVLGGVFGFVIGFALMAAVGQPLIDFYHAQSKFDYIVGKLEGNMNLWVFIAAFSPIPYKVFTIAAGVVASGMDGGHLTFFLWFLAASAIGRGGRFFLVSWLIHRYGERVKQIIDKYFNWCALAFAVVLVGAILLLKYIF